MHYNVRILVGLVGQLKVKTIWKSKGSEGYTLAVYINIDRRVCPISLRVVPISDLCIIFYFVSRCFFMLCVAEKKRYQPYNNISCTQDFFVKNQQSTKF